MMTPSDGLTAPAALNPFNGRDVPQPPADSVPAYTRSPAASAASGNYTALPTVDQIEYQSQQTDLMQHANAVQWQSRAELDAFSLSLCPDIAHTGSGSKISIEVDDSSKDGVEGVRSASTASPTPSSGSAPFYSLAYYKSYFDITTDTLFSRISRAVNPASAAFYSDESGAPADLYGPFWITSTLVLLIAVCSNLASYIDWKLGEDAESDDDKEADEEQEAWKYDFSKLSVATSVFYSLISWLPVLLYFLLSRSGQAKGLVDIVSIMGYSFSPLLFVTLLLVIPSDILRWVVVAVGCVLQSWFLLKNLWTDRSNGKVMPVVILTVAICLGIALLYRWYFFSF